jgi:acetaldehyde dehydrogenase (acetylating)
MTLGCGAIAGNSTSDNIGPLHLINVKRLAYDRASPTRQGGDSVLSGVAPRNAEHASNVARPNNQGNIDRSEIAAAVERYLARRSVVITSSSINTPAPPAPATPAPLATPEPALVDFVCEDDVRQAIRDSRKIFIGPKAIVTPSARDLAGPHDILVLVKK